MNQPKVTVVIPIYNVENYLNRCVRSVVSQTYRNLEILLVDDGSPDRCPEICDEWAKKDERIKVIHKANAGLGMARNTGIDNATGEYIFFFDSDDYVDKTIVEKCVMNAQSNMSDVVVFGYSNVFENGDIKRVELTLEKTVFEGAEILNKLIPGMYTYDMGFGISAWGKMYRLNSITEKQIRFKSEREIISEDAYFALEYYSNIQKATIVDESLYFYYKRNDSLSRAYKKDRQENNDKFIEQSISYIEKESLPMSVKNHIFARYHMYTVAAIRQLMKADISSKDRDTELMRILKSQTLNKTLNFEVLKLHKIAVAILLFCVKMKLYPLCRVLIGLRK